MQGDFSMKKLIIFIIIISLIGQQSYAYEMCPKFKEKNGPYAEDAFNREYYQKALNNKIVTQFDLMEDSYPILTREQWKSIVPKTANKNFYKLIDAVFEETSKSQKVGMPVNPDFLIALSAHETGWGNNKYSQDRNNYFSMNAINSDPNKAFAYATINDSVRDVINWMYKNVDYEKKFYSPVYGRTIIAINTYYAGDYWKGTNYWVSSETWAYNIGRILEKSFGKYGINP